MNFFLCCFQGVAEAVEGQVEDAQFKLIDLPNVDVFGAAAAKTAESIICPNCNRLVSASRFAPHLEKCMGMGRAMGRKASRRIGSKLKNEGSIYGSSCISISDDEDDSDWQGERKKKKLNSIRSNGNKKNGK